MEKGKCKYCGTTAVAKYGNICGNCYQKLKLIRTIKQMLKEAKETKPTNYDRIKDMTVDEMAEFLMDWFTNCMTGKAPLNVVKWLESEVETK